MALCNIATCIIMYICFTFMFKNKLHVSALVNEECSRVMCMWVDVFSLAVGL